MFLEVWTEKFPITFDGLVVEAFTTGDNGRYHIAHIKEISLGQGRKGGWHVTIDAFPYGGLSNFDIPDSSVTGVQQLIAEVNRVRHERYSLGPVKS